MKLLHISKVYTFSLGELGPFMSGTYDPAAWAPPSELIVRVELWADGGYLVTRLPDRAELASGFQPGPQSVSSAKTIVLKLGEMNREQV